VLLDIQEACQSKLPILHRQLMYAHKHAFDSFGFKLRADGGMTTEGLNWPNSGVHTIQGTFELLKKIEIPMFPIMKGFMLQIVAPPKLYTYENAPPEMKASWGERPPPEMEAAMKRTMIDFIRPAPADNFAYVHNPLHSGSVILKLLLDYQKAGLALANWHLSIFVVAHLYNAMRQLNLLKEQWGVMDRIIRLHKKELFADVIPTKTVDITDRMAFRMNLATTQKRWFEDEKWKLKETAASPPLRLLLEDEPRKQARGVWQIEQRIESTSTPAANQAALIRTANMTQQRKEHLTPTNYVANLQKTFDSILDDASIDYIRLTKHCYALLEDFRKYRNIEMQSRG
jgi:hypothetical protein